jgi:hypothetical protein
MGGVENAEGEKSQQGKEKGKIREEGISAKGGVQK